MDGIEIFNIGLDEDLSAGKVRDWFRDLNRKLDYVCNGSARKDHCTLGVQTNSTLIKQAGFVKKVK